MNKKPKSPVTIAKWIWSSYLKTALIPVILIQIVFFGIFIAINLRMKHELSRFLDSNVNAQITRLSGAESSIINHQLDCIQISTELYAAQMEKALQTPAALSALDAARLQYSPDGAYYTTTDSGGAAVYYSGFKPVGEAERDKVARALTLQSLMQDITRTNPLVTSIYLNTYDSLNVIYPYFDVIKQYTPKVDITSFNFYYEADAAHDQDRASRWTNAYLDPAGHGWMVSSIKPVYNGDFLEGVVGVDVTVGQITDQILRMELPGSGYGILVGSDGTILALPEKGEADWGLSELTGHDYDEAIKKDTFKPDEFNLFKMENMGPFAQELTANPKGSSIITLGTEKKLVSWDTVEETGWKLILIIPQHNIYQPVDKVGAVLQKVGLIMTGGIVAFYIIFFRILYKRSRKLSQKLSQPLVALNNMAFDIGTGNYHQKLPEFNVAELQMTALTIAGMGQSLGEINKNLLSAQNELKEKETYLQAVIYSIDDAIVELDENGLITNLFLNDPKNTPAKPAPRFTSIDSLFEKGKAELILQKLHEVVETGQPATIETDVETFSGVRWAQARVSLVSRDPVRVVVTARDITERKEAEESVLKARDAAEAANRAKSQFLSSMSHELRTPLNAVLGFAQVLELDPSTPLTGMQKECVYEIMTAGNHLLELINEVLDLARIEAGKTLLSIEPVSINTIIEETMALIIPTGQKYGINVYADACSCQGGYVKADKTKLKQILVNLLSNAVKYNKPKGKVEFRCETNGTSVRFHIVDTGIGIPAHEMEAIFEPFYRLNNTKNVIEGTGVGLSLVRQLTEMMGGTVTAESTEGEGSHFCVELPAAEEMTLWGERGEAAAHTSAGDFGGPAEKKILYIEDNHANLRLVERVLGLMPGTAFMSSPSAELGIEKARREKPDVILMDINLPGMDGYEAFLKLRGDDETKDIPVIAVTSNAMEREIERAMEMGFFDYITKPIKADQFLERIKRVFHKE